MRNNIKKGLALGAVLAAVGGFFGSPAAQATPAGLTFYPSTDIYGKGNWHFDADTFIDADETDNGAVSNSYGLSYGIGPERDGLFGRSEIGVDYVSNFFFSSNTGFDGEELSFGRRLLFNAKTQLYNNDDSQIRVVGGIWGLGSKALYAPNVAYVTGSKNTKAGRFHLGVARSLQNEDVVGEDRTNLHLGYDKVFANGKLQFTLDYYSGDTAYSALAPGLIYYINDKAAVQIGYIKPNEKALFGPDQVYLAFDYNFGNSGTEAPAPAPETSTTAPATQ